MRKKILTWVIATSICIMGTNISMAASYKNETSRTSFKVLESNYKKATIERLTNRQFENQFGKNIHIPRTNEAVLKLSKKLYSKEGRDEIKEECGEYSYGLLYAALSNPQITENTIDRVGEASDADMPALPSTYTSGHFKIHYTTSDTNADNNVTLANVQDTATVLNNAWNDYATNFKEPKHYVSGGVKYIDVNVYYLGSTLNGETSSSWDYINLNSKSVVSNQYKRQTTPVHELFHRVEYSYGYVTGTANMKWATEGTASWSQKYRASNIGDWMGRMNEGLNNPDSSLIGRSYDACHYWCYLGQRTTGGGYGGVERNFIKKAWETYQTNGKNMKNAVDSAIKDIIGASYSFDSVNAWWMFANFYKDMTNASTAFDYQEDEWTRIAGTATYGPLAHVPRTSTNLNLNTTYTTSGNVNAYGADYYVFNIANNVSKVEITSTSASNNFGYAVIKIKDGNAVGYQRDPAGGKNGLSYVKEFAPGSISQIAVAVMGNPGGGNYSITARGLDKRIVVADPNELSVPDSRDFKQITLQSTGTNLNADIDFYAVPTLSEFFFYADTDGVAGADVCIYCHQSDFKVYKATSAGYFNNLVYTGVPTITGTKYSLSIPWSTSFGSANTLGIWLYDMSAKDRIKDSGNIAISK